MTKEEAVAEVVDEILRDHGVITSQIHDRDFLERLQEHGYKVVKIREGDKS